ncbi:unnamed protein product [Lactuca virosa]|uniref:Phosphate-induced protein 1 n=1 Tax=Lactuca virosa TaxID=75947 RepID=A0AAU9PW04_9ASTR|nr:unnamed protein product [Lactuca virosa]
MATTTFPLHLLFVILFSILHASFATRKLTELLPDSSDLMKYHNGPLLSGNISVNLIWYGNFNPTQKSIISDFITSLSVSTSATSPKPSVATWWKTTENYHTKSNNPTTLSLSLAKQTSDPTYSIGKSLTNDQLVKLASNHASENTVNIVLTAEDVTVTGFCSSRCGTLKSSYKVNGHDNKGKKYRFVYIWVGNSVTQCPGQCAWPFHQPIYGPQGAPLVAPNNDVGVDGMVINLASLLAATATNPFGNGYYQGDASAPLEAASACQGVYGKGAYPGYPGDLLVDGTTGASFNAYGTNGRKYLVPSLFDPLTSTCSTFV